MLITRLELENFKSYASACIAFTPGTNAIIGANGAGKSSLLEAIGFALFDYRPEGLKTENLLREGATAGRVVVGLVSSRDERAYDVERAFGATATTRYRVYDAEIGAYVAQGAEEVAHWLRDHLSSGSDIRLRDLFVNTVGVPQGTITAPFLQAPSARKAIFDPLLQAADWAKASDALLPTQRSLEGQAAQLREAIARLEGELTRLEPLLAERAALEEASAQMAARLADLERDLTGATAALQRLDAAERALRESQERLNSARVEARSLEARLSDARQALAEAVEARQRVAGSRPGYEAYLEAEGRLRELDRQRARRDKLVARQSALQRDEAAQ
ncbi:MAG: SMC family ATPase, partial [Chloroflexi bacterium]|nr:SMC family ATPase [Chloroflexota bacterium]